MRKEILSTSVIITFIVVLLSSCRKSDEVAIVPVITTNEITNINDTTAICGGEITSNGGDIIIEQGICWSKTENPTILDSKSINSTNERNFSCNIKGLSLGTSYYVRAYATNSAGTGYGQSILFTTTGVVDYDGNTYKTVKIGTQIWMAENLKTTHYNDGTPINHLIDYNEWQNATAGAYCWYNNNQSSAENNNYGLLYNWHAVKTGLLCPKGWHIPSDAEWTVLENYLASDGYAGNEGLILKSISGWSSNDIRTDKYGFSALPGGGRSYEGIFNNGGNNGYWWSNTEVDLSLAKSFALYKGYNLAIHGEGDKRNGISIRCIKN